MPLYFAYGSNMDVTAMHSRAPASRPLGLARLARHRFLVMPEGYASVARDPRGTVWGLLWDLALSDVPALDRYESLHTGLYTKIVQPVLTQGGTRQALVYVGHTTRTGVPKPGYMEGVLAAARAAGLPESALADLALWLPRQAGPAREAAKPVAPGVTPIAASPSERPASGTVSPGWSWRP